MSDNQEFIDGEAYWVLTSYGWELCQYEYFDESSRYFLTFGNDEEVIYQHKVIKTIHVPHPKDTE